MSLCWTIYHFFHHKFSKNSNKPPKMHRPVIRIDIQRKKNCAKKCHFWPPRGCEKMVIFHTWHLQKKSFSFLRVLPLNPGIHEIHSQIAVGVIQNKKFKILKSLNSKNTLICHCAEKFIIFFIINSQKTQINHPRCTNLWSQIYIRRKKNLQNSAFSDHRGAEKKW